MYIFHRFGEVACCNTSSSGKPGRSWRTQRLHRSRFSGEPVGLDRDQRPYTHPSAHALGSRETGSCRRSTRHGRPCDCWPSRSRRRAERFGEGYCRRGLRNQSWRYKGVLG
jgi:hypothetical protein